MGLIEWDPEPINPFKYYAILHNHKLLPDWQKNNESYINAIAGMTYYAVIYDTPGHDAKAIAILLQFVGPDPSKMDLTFIPCVRNINDPAIKSVLREAGKDFREAWFNVAGYKRVECRIPLRRKHPISALKTFGFKAESGSSGLRNAADYGNGPENIALFSLLPGDLPYTPIDIKDTAHDSIVVEEGAIRGEAETVDAQDSTCPDELQPQSLPEP